MRVEDSWSFGFPPEGSVSRSRGPDEAQEVFGVGPWLPSGNVRYALSPEDYGGASSDVFGIGGAPPGHRLPWEGSKDVFGLGDPGCNCPPINIKNASMLGVGTILAIFGVKSENDTWNIVARTIGGAVAFFGLMDIVGGFSKRKAPAPAAPPEGATTEGLGSEWYADTPVNSYNNWFAAMLESQHRTSFGQCVSCGLGDCSCKLMGLGQIEYWIHDPEDMQMPLLKMQCPPFMVAPGYVIVKHGPKGYTQAMPVEPPTMWGLGGLGFWEILSPDGTRIAASRCRPYESDNTLTIKQVSAGREVLRQSGAAPYPEGTMRPRQGPLRTTRRG